MARSIFQSVFGVVAADKLTADEASHGNASAGVAKMVTVTNGAILCRHVAKVAPWGMSLTGLTDVVSAAAAVGPDVVAATDGPPADVTVDMLGAQIWRKKQKGGHQQKNAPD